jgi:RND family efflux transporter MFP subunit
VNAQSNLDTAQARLQAAQNGTLDAQRKAVQSQVDAAREKLTADQAHLEQLVAGPQDEEVQAAQDAVDQASQALALAQHPATPEDIAAQQALVEQARQQLLKAQQPYSDYDIQQQSHAVAQAEAALHARANPYTDQDLATAQAQVDQAQAAVQQAQLTLNQTQITAPVDGVVRERLVSPGALVGPQSNIVTLIPPAVEVVASVDDSQLTAIQVGQPARMRLSTYPDQSIGGSVIAVSPAVDPKTRTAEVRVAPSDAQVRLVPGSQAMVTIVSQTPDALVVPRDAIIGGAVAGGPATVVTVDGNRAERKSIRLGEVNDQVAEVVSGLSEGELVATANAADINTGDVVTAVPQTAEVTHAE